jgi:hypothetical protein
MAKGYPSMIALLGLAAFAGYQNREKIKEWIGARREEWAQNGELSGRAHNDLPRHKRNVGRPRRSTATAAGRHG